MPARTASIAHAFRSARRPAATPAGLALAALIASAPAQHAQVFDCGPALTAVDWSTPQVKRATDSLAHLRGMLVRYFQEENRQKPEENARRRTVLTPHGATRSLLFSGDQERAKLVESTLAQLQATPIPELRLQVTLSTMPAAAAQAQGLQHGGLKPITEPEAGKLLKLALQHGGTLKNFPETAVLPLVPFVIAQPPDAASAPAPRQEMKVVPTLPPYVHGEALPIADSEAIFCLRVQPGPAPADGTELAFASAQVLRLRVGEGAVLSAVKDGEAAVVWVRFAAQGRLQPPVRK
jgi:hypothetical protein